ncbi:MAG TPA: hypothetical protein VFD58_08390 [Blastocatellia bacterium]|nr:hypothetical protein [Blastocatellia bacterium]
MQSDQPNNKREYFARMIADAFGDRAQLSLYVNYCRKYPLSLIYRAFAEAQSVPEASIRKSRAAIFFFLINRYTHEQKQNPPAGPTKQPDRQIQSQPEQDRQPDPRH